MAEKTKLDQRAATLTDYGIDVNQAGDAIVVLEFDVPEEGGKLTYWGYLKGGSLPFVLDALAALGYKGKDGSDLVEGPDGMALKLGTAVSVAVGDNVYNGKTYRNISFVNTPGGGVKRADPVLAKAKLRALGLEAELAKHRQGAPKAASKDDSDVPF